jgi:AraC family transcriptional regulator, regulatory protein of adaptative response / DNA-3-methyladenine glycosylase II
MAGADARGEQVFRLAFRPPYDWGSLLAFLAARATPGVEEVVSGAYRRSFVLGGRHGIVQVARDRRAPALELRVRFPGARSLRRIVTRVRAMFDLAADPAAIVTRFRGDPLLGPLARARPGLRVPGAWDPFELTVRAVLGQQVSVAGATTLAGRLAERHGTPLEVADAGGLTRLFPSAAALARAGIRGLPRARARTIGEIARAVLAGRLRFDAPAAGTLAELHRIRGVGDWTAQYVALRALGERDAFPAGDLVLLREAGDGVPLSQRALRERAEEWRPWRAYAALHLWRAAAERSRPARSLSPGGRRSAQR